MPDSTTSDSALTPDALILDSMGVALMAVDEQCRVIRFTAPAEQLTGLSSDEIVGRPCAEALLASACYSTCPIKEALRSGTSCRYGTVTLQSPDRRPLNIELTASALFDGRGEVIGAVGLLRDLSQAPDQVRIYGSRIFVSRTPAMRHLFDALPKLASSDAPLLIAGDRGSGRGALAETVHLLGGRGARPLLHLRCGEPHRGERDRLREAERTLDDDEWRELRRAGGTLLLEEIDRASSALQLKLLAWLEDEAGGGSVRLLSTAGRDVERRVDARALRADLYYRLGVLHVDLPNLAERIEDLPILVEQLLEDLNLRHGKGVEGLSTEAMRSLLRADYPHNIRQLRGVIEQAHARCRGSRIEFEHLQDLVPTATSAGEPSSPWRTRKADLEQAAIEGALRRCQGSLGRAALELGMHRTTLWRKIKRYRLKT